MELKTLNDIFEEEGKIQCCRDCKIDIVKLEAIKHIKELDCDNLTISNGLVSTEEGFENYNIKQTNKSALILWIKYFFNITKEDLKGEFKLEKRSFLDRISYLLNEVKCYRISEEQFELQMKVAVRDLE